MIKYTLLDADRFSRDREYTAIDEPPSHSLSRVIKELIGRVLLSGKCTSTSGKSPATTTSRSEASKPGSAQPFRSSRTSSGTVSNDSTRLDLRAPYLTVYGTPSSAPYAGTVPVEHFVEWNHVSKSLEGYTQNTQNVAALKRARDQDLAVHPGQDIEYVVVDDEKNSRERVALANEDIETYDPRTTRHS